MAGTGKIKISTRLWELLIKPIQALTQGEKTEVEDFLERHEDPLSNYMANQQVAPWRTQIGPDQFEGDCGCVFDSQGHMTKWCGDHYISSSS